MLLYGLLLTINATPSLPQKRSNELSDRLVPPPFEQPSVSINNGTENETTFMQRIAKWFGYGNEVKRQMSSIPQKQQLPPMPQKQQMPQHPQAIIQQRYSDISPTDQSNTYTKSAKTGCNPCNKEPWIPMVSSQRQFPIVKENQIGFVGQPMQTQQHYQPQIQVQQPKFAYSPQINFYRSNYVPQHILLPTYASNYLSASQPLPIITKPEYRPPVAILPLQQVKPRLAPIPIPNLSMSPLPPIYDAKPFRIEHSLSYNQNFNTYKEAVPFNYYQGSPSHRSNFDASLTLVPPPPVSLPHKKPVAISSSNNNDIEIVKSVSLGEFTSTIEYPPSISQTPIIDLTNDRPSHSDNSYSQPEYISQPIIVNNHDLTAVDSYPSASSHNFTTLNEEKDHNFERIELLRNVDVDDIESTTIILPDLVKSETILSKSNTPVNIQNETNHNLIKKDRDTPVNLLDSPIYYLRKNELKFTTKSPSEIKFTKHPEIDYTPWTPSSPNQFLHTTLPIVSPSTVTQSSPFTVTKPHAAPPEKSSTPSYEKKPKQIQLIIPYTTNNHPSPFKRTKFQDFDSSSGWSEQSYHLHDSQESQVVTSTVTKPPTPRRTTKYLTKILATNLRDLLKKEKNGNYTPVDISKLQKNIDVWTEQEFSMLPNRASTISLFGQPKNIPSEYLTTPSFSQYSTTSTAFTDIDYTSTVQPIDEEYKAYDVLGRTVSDNKYIVQNSISETATNLPSPFKLSSSSEPTELWNKLNVDISPLTKEKVYVVTPQPWADDNDLVGTFKSPRFLIRPTPGALSTSQADRKLTIPETSK